MNALKAPISSNCKDDEEERLVQSSEIINLPYPDCNFILKLDISSVFNRLSVNVPKNQLKFVKVILYNTSHVILESAL